MSFYQRLQSQYANLYLTCLAAFVFLMMIDLSYAVPFIFPMYTIYLAVKLVAFFILIVFLLRNDLTQRIRLAVIISLLCFYFFSKRSGDSDFFYYAIFAVTAWKIDFQKIIWTFFWIGLPTASLIILASLLKVIPTQVMDGRPGFQVLRFSLGFLTPTDLAARVFYLLLAYYTWHKFQISIPGKIISIILVALTFLLTNSRLDLVMMLLLLAIVLFPTPVKKSLRQLGSYFLSWLVAFYLIIFLALTVSFDPQIKFFKILNDCLSKRLSLGQRGLFNHGITLFGQHVVEHSNGNLSFAIQKDYFYIDSSYIRLLVISGLITTMIVCSAIFYLIYLFSKKQTFSLLIALLLVIISSAIDQHLLQLSYNFILLAVFADLSAGRDEFDYS
ncbi:hypothetical protein [Liquorilactobacillus sicerae]|uniref:hypothetical protein n=1 Tax=Liquorilactobacillus sicerae TaxID=1416943 RepID=UPI00247FC2AC|nr:hypothetical protein [Liquorilactobacillus sicerae]